MRAQKITNGDRTFRTYHGDCIEVMRTKIEPKSVDVVVTSPPYNLSAPYVGYSDNLVHGDYMAWTGDWIAFIERVLVDDGSFFLNVGSIATSPMLPFEMVGMGTEMFMLQNVIHWIKSISIDSDDLSSKMQKQMPGGIASGHFKPLNSERFVNQCHEYIFHFTKSGNVPLDRLAIGTPYADKSNQQRWMAGGSGKRCRGNVWFIPYETIMDRKTERPHPATFPVKLPLRCIQLHGKENPLVFDPFVGIGATALAALACDADFIGCDIIKEYVDETCRRLQGAIRSVR